MKSLEDLNLMTMPMLEKIHMDLTGNKPKFGMTKPKLVQRVYDLQQPAPPSTEDQESSKDDTQGAENSAAGENSLDDLMGDDAAAKDLSVGDEDLIGEDPATEPVMPAKWNAPHSDKAATHKDVKKALAHLPLQIEADETGITIISGSKRLYTTINQPLHRIVATAETFAGVRK